MNWNRNTLENHRMLQLNNRGEFEVEVIKGAVYVTKEGDRKDYIVRSGETLHMEGKGRIVIEGFPNAEVSVCS